MLSEQLLLDRAGNFSSSENHKLMAGWDDTPISRDFDEFAELYPVLNKSFLAGDKKPLIKDLESVTGVKFKGASVNQTWSIIRSEQPAQGLVTYAEEKAAEVLSKPDPSLTFSTVHTRNGEEREAECMRQLAKATGLNFVQTGEHQSHIHAHEVGCTPDGIVLDDIDLTKTGGEAKCKSIAIHLKNLLINNNDDLKENAFDHFVQIQTAMLVTSAQYWYFANYNPYAIEPLRFKYIRIERDNEFIAIMQKRIDLAKKIKAEFIAKFNPMINSEKLTA